MAARTLYIEKMEDLIMLNRKKTKKRIVVVHPDGTKKAVKPKSIFDLKDIFTEGQHE